MRAGEPGFVAAPRVLGGMPPIARPAARCSRGGWTKEILHFSLQFFIYSEAMRRESVEDLAD